MGIERSSFADRKGNKFCELPKVTSKATSKSKKNRRRLMKMSPVQRLYETCKEVFAFSGAGIVPSPEDINRLRSVLDDMKPEDVSLSTDMPYFRKSGARKTPPITYLHLYACDKFSIGIFCLPPSGVIPLHNHPGMTVFSKLLFGTLHIKSYDWVVDAASNASSDKAIASVNPSENGGNMHCFTAVRACAVLDVLCPPYSDRDGRHCTYYIDFPFPKFSVEGVSVAEEEREGFAWLQEREEEPEDVNVVGGKYLGPKIVEN